MSLDFLDTIREYYTPDSTPENTGNGETRDYNGTTSAYAQAALTNETTKLANTPEGGRNHQLFKSAANLAQLVAGGELPAQIVQDELTRAAALAGIGGDEVRATIASAGRAGAQEPRQTPPQDPIPDVTTLQPPEGIEQRTQDGDLTEEDRQYLTQLQRNQRINEEIERERARREARRVLDAEDNLANFRIPEYRPNLTEELQIEDPPLAYTVDRILPVGGNVLLTAQFKTGKTTFMNNLAKALADGTDFLGEYAINIPDGGRVALFNYEVDDRQYRAWLRETGITNTNRVTLLNLRGYRIPITVKYVEDWLVEWLKQHRITTWIVDPFARAFTGSGISENDNTEVGKFLDTLDVIKKRAGVQDLILPTHTGREKFEEGEERARGATRLDDWADVRWLLTKDEEDIRYFRATGRDVDVPEQKLTFDEPTRAITIGGGDRAWEKRRRGERAVVDHVQANPGCSKASIFAALRSANYRGREDALQGHIDAAVFGHKVTEVKPESNGGKYTYWPVGATVLGVVS